MKASSGWVGGVAVALMFSVISIAQTAIAPAKKRHTKPAAPAATQEDVQSLRDLVQSQQKEIEAQSQQVQQLQDQLHQLLDAVQQANANSQKSQAGLSRRRRLRRRRNNELT